MIHYVVTSRSKSKTIIIKFVTIVCFTLISIFSIPLSASLQSNIVNAQVNCNCTPSGTTVDQGCAAFGCPVGTRRLCTCGMEADSGQCVLPNASYNPLQHGLWACRCQPDAACNVISDPGGGGGGSCDPNAWGACSVTCGGGTQTNACGTTRACNTQSCCNAVAPSAFTQISPINNHVFSAGTSNIPLSWNQTSFGTNCAGDVNTYTIWVYRGGTCSTAINDLDVSPTVVNGAWTRGDLPSSSSGYTWPGLGQNGTSYCWLVLKSNGDQFVTTAFWNFSVANPTPPSVPTNPVVTPTCSNGDVRLHITWSGAPGDSYHIDIDNEASFANSYYNYPYPNPATTNTSPTLVDGNFTRYNPTDNAPLTMTGGTTYYARVYSTLRAGAGLNPTTSGTTSFVAPNCATPQAPQVTATCGNANGSSNMRISWDVIPGWSDDGIFIDISPDNNTFGDNLHYNLQIPAGGPTNQGYIDFNSFNQYFTRYPNPGTQNPVQVRFEPGRSYWIKIYYIRYGNNSAPNYAAGNSAVRQIGFNGCCGDGYRSSGEACDNGDINGTVCPLGSTAGSTCTYCSTTCTVSTLYNPIGNHDTATCSGVTGWTCNPQNFAANVDVHVYARDLTTGSPTLNYVGAATANQTRGAAIADLCGGNGNRGFNVPINSIVDGNLKQVYVYAIGGNGSNPLLLTSPRNIDTSTCITQPIINGASVTNDTCGTGFSGQAGSLNPNVTNPLTFFLSAQEPTSTIQRMEFYMVPRTATDGPQNGVFEGTATPLRSTVMSKVAQTQGIAISFDPATRVFYTLNSSNNWVAGTEGVDTSTYRADVTANMTGTTQNPQITFRTEFDDDFFNGTYSIYYTAINSSNATPENGATANPNLIRLTRWGNWGIDMDPPSVIVGAPNFLASNTYQLTRTSAESADPNQSGLNLALSRAYVHTSNSGAQYQYKVNDPDPFISVPIIYQANPPFPATSSNVSAGINETHTYQDLQSSLQIPINHTLYVSDNACNVGVGTQSVAAQPEEPAWLMSVGGSISVGGEIRNVTIPDTDLDIEGYYEGESALTTESLISGTNVIPSQRVSLKDNIITQYTDESINIPGESNFDTWYDHLLDRVQRDNNTTLDSIGNVEIDSNFSQSGLFPQLNAVKNSTDATKDNTEETLAYTPVNLELLREHADLYPTATTVQANSFNCRRCNVNGNSFCPTSQTLGYCDADYGFHYESCSASSPTSTCSLQRTPLQTLTTVPTIRCYMYNGQSCVDAYFAGNTCPQNWASTSSAACSGLQTGQFQTLYRCTTNPYDGNNCEGFTTTRTQGSFPYATYTSQSQCQNNQQCFKKEQTKTCYRCTASLADASNACESVQVMGSICPTGYNDSNACTQSTCPRTLTCYTCTASLTDANTCEAVSFTGSGTCESNGYSSSSVNCRSMHPGSVCPYNVTCYRCTDSLNDGNTCQAYQISNTIYNAQGCNQGGSLNASCQSTQAGGYCPMNTTCYRCTQSTTDGNACEPFVVSGPTCPSGTSANAQGCAQEVGGTCVADITCYSCSSTLSDGNTCVAKVFSGLTSCPTGTSANPQGCAAAVGGSCSQQITCYQCSASSTDGNTCQAFSHFGSTCPAGTSNSPTGCAAAVGGVCAGEITCSRCTESQTDAGLCEVDTFQSVNCPAGWVSGSNTCTNCAAQIECSRCTQDTSDGISACENETFTVSSGSYTCPAGWVKGTNTCGNSCTIQKTCYRCTTNTSDGNACESFSHTGFTCPSGSTENPNCAAIQGGSCPAQITCYRCSDAVGDGNSCQAFTYSGVSCPAGTSPNNQGCSTAAGGTCTGVITCYKCSNNKFDGNACEPFVHTGSTCPAGTSNTPTSCHISNGGSCPAPELQDSLEAVMVDTLTIKSGAVCDQQGIVFVKEDLIIEPDLLTAHNQNGCIFIVQGDVIVTKGSQKTINVDAFSATPAQYDIIEGFFIVGGNFITELDDVPGDSLKWDGLIVKGGVYAQNLSLNRNLNGNGNANLERPAHLFIYDPRYKQIYEKNFGSRFYSLREITE